MATSRAKKREIKGSHNIIVGFYHPKKSITLMDYINAYGLKVNQVKKAAKEIGIETCLNGHH